MPFKVGDMVVITKSGADGARVFKGDIGVIIDKAEYPNKLSYSLAKNAHEYAVRFDREVGGYFDPRTPIINELFLVKLLEDADIFEDVDAV